MSSPPVRRLPRPRWLDGRLLLGLILVLGSVAVGTRVVASVNDTQLVWAATADLAAGTPLAKDHLRRIEVRLPADTPARYLDVDSLPLGHVLTRPVSAGELVPADAISTAGAGAAGRRLVTVPVEQFHYPDDLHAGELVDVYVSVNGDDAQPDSTASLVAPSLTVAAVHGGSRSGFGAVAGGLTGVELSVPVDAALRLVEALQSGPVDLVRVPTGG